MYFFYKPTTVQVLILMNRSKVDHLTIIFFHKLLMFSVCLSFNKTGLYDIFHCLILGLTLMTLTYSMTLFYLSLFEFFGDLPFVFTIEEFRNRLNSKETFAILNFIFFQTINLIFSFAFFYWGRELNREIFELLILTFLLITFCEYINAYEVLKIKIKNFNRNNFTELFTLFLKSMSLLYQFFSIIFYSALLGSQVSDKTLNAYLKSLFAYFLYKSVLQFKNPTCKKLVLIMAVSGLLIYQVFVIISFIASNVNIFEDKYFFVFFLTLIINLFCLFKTTEYLMRQRRIRNMNPINLPQTVQMFENLEMKKILFEKIIKNDLENKLVCSICTFEFANNDEILNIKCSHIFHFKCLSEWLKINSSCPNCRKSVNINDFDEVVQPLQQS